MKKAITILLIMFCLNMNSQSKDKVKHFTAGLLISATTNTIVYSLTKKKKKSFWYGYAVAVIVGIGKEGFDEYRYNGWDNKDLLATVLGGLSGSAIITITINF